MALLSWIPEGLARWADENPNFRTSLPLLGLAFFLCLGFSLGRIKWPITFGASISLLTLIIAESGQVFLPHRSCDWKDMVWGILGVILGIIFAGMTCNLVRVNRQKKLN
jgi:VanZ family protein